MKAMLIKPGLFRTPVVYAGVLAVAVGLPGIGTTAVAQATAATPAAAAARQIGTVKAISGTSITLATDSGQQVVVTVAEGARVLQLAPGSTNLKDAQTIELSAVSTGDRVLVTGKQGDDASTFSAVRVILMKSTEIAQKRDLDQADWQKRGSGGIVTAVDAAGTITISSGTKKIQVNTTSSTKFRRYAGDSVKFEDAKPGTLAEIHPGDQLRVRGAKSDDGLAIQAEEVVSGSFKNLSGVIATLDTTGGMLTLKDLTTKKMITVKITTNSSVHTLPARAAAMFAARVRGGAAGAPASGSAGAGAQGGAPGAGVQGGGAQGGAPARTEGAGGAPGGGAGQGNWPGAGGGMRPGGGDLSTFVNRLPAETISDLKVGDAVMIVASQAEPGSTQVTAVTLLSGVEPILAASPSGSSEMTLSPWSVGSGAPEGGAQ
jgi:co-chaperonin GroES (HSP10)